MKAPTLALRFCVVLILLSLPFIGSASDIVWTNTAGGTWGNPANWNPNLVPGPPDTAQITNAGSYVVTLDVDGIISRLILGGASGTQSVSHAGVTLTLRNPSKIGSNGVYRMMSGFLDGNGDLLVEGKLEWVGGTMQGSGRTIIPEGHPLKLDGAGYLGRRLDLRGGGVILTTLNGVTGGEITIFPGQTLDMIEGAGLGAIVNNYGTLRKTGPGTVSVYNELNNHGLVQALEGSLLTYGGISSGRFEVGDAAVLSFAGGHHTVTNGVSFGATGSGRLQLGGGTLTVTSDLTIDPVFEMTRISAFDVGMDGDGSITFNGGFNWTAGFIQGKGKIIIPPQASLSIKFSNFHPYFARDVDVYGACDVVGSLLGVVSLRDAKLTIFPGATCALLGAGFIPHPGTTSAVINNMGTIRKMVGGSGTIGWVLNNAGVVQLGSGSLNLTGGGSSSGTFEMGNGTMLNYAGGIHTVNSGAVFSASGSAFLRVTGGVFRVNADLTMNPTFELTGQGILDGESDITFSNTFNWFGGTMQGSGRTITAAGTRMAILGNNFTKTLLRNLDLRGYGSISGTPNLLGGAGANFTIFPTATFDLLDDPTLASAGIGDIATLINQGLLRKPEGAGTATLGFKVLNSGTVDSQSGTIGFPGGYIQTAGATLLSGGNFAGGLLDLQGGQMSGAGNIAANVRSAADVFPGGPLDFLNISSASPQTFANTTSGTLNIQLGGLVPGTTHDQLRINGSVNLAGTLNLDLINGFVPTVGNSFTVMTYTARSGVFSSIAAPVGVYFQPVYSPTNLVLNTVSQDDVLTPLHVLVPSGLVGTSTNRAFKITMTGEAGRNYELHAQTNVAAPFASWELLGLMTPDNRLFEYRDGSVENLPRRFYRAKQVP